MPSLTLENTCNVLAGLGTLGSFTDFLYPGPGGLLCARGLRYCSPSTGVLHVVMLTSGRPRDVLNVLNDALRLRLRPKFLARWRCLSCSFSDMVPSPSITSHKVMTPEG